MEFGGVDRLQLKCFVYFPGPIAMGDMERSLHCQILQNDGAVIADLERVKAESISNAQFATREEE